MDKHYLVPKIAEKFGMKEGVLAAFFHNWLIVEKDSNKSVFYENGDYWRLTPLRELCELMPYMTRYEISTALNRLVRKGVLLKSQNHVDCYALSDKGKELLKDYER